MTETLSEKFAGVSVTPSMYTQLVKYSSDNKHTSYASAARALFAVGLKPAAPVVDVMKPPAGAVLIKELSKLTDWTREVNGYLTQPAGVGPAGEPILRNTLIDGQNSNPYPGSEGVERNDLRGPNVELNTTYWMTFYMRVNSLPDISGGGFLMLGPHEIHGQTLNQATAQPMIGIAEWQAGPEGIGNHIFEANAGRDTHDLKYVGPVDLGKWHQWKFGIHYTQNSNGWAELWRDGVRVYRNDGPTTSEALPGYWKLANYRNAGMPGVSQFDISSCRLYKS